MSKKDERKWYALNAEKCGMGGVITTRPTPRKQDKQFIEREMFAVVFFPTINGIGPAQWCTGNSDTLSQTPEAAITKFMDGIAKSEKWETYHKAGHRVRKVKIVDLGDAGDTAS